MKGLVTAAILACVPATSFAETVVVPANGSVPETVERLKASVEDAGARVFSVVDFGGAVKRIGGGFSPSRSPAITGSVTVAGPVSS